MLQSKIHKIFTNCFTRVIRKLCTLQTVEMPVNFFAITLIILQYNSHVPRWLNSNIWEDPLIHQRHDIFICRMTWVLAAESSSRYKKWCPRIEFFSFGNKLKSGRLRVWAVGRCGSTFQSYLSSFSFATLSWRLSGPVVSTWFVHHS